MNKPDAPSFQGNKIDCRLIAEWEPQDAILVAWPHRFSDWAPILQEAEHCFANIITAITPFVPVVLLHHGDKQLAHFFSAEVLKRIRFIQVPFNDTWVRDYAFLSFEREHQKAVADFNFNGWGLKYAAALDNQVNRYLFESKKIFASTTFFDNKKSFTLEGGGIESNGHGIVLLNRYWLDQPNRNDGLSIEDREKKIGEMLGARKVITVDIPSLVGDDTDGHIDTIARFIGEKSIAYVAPSDPASPNYPKLRKLEIELQRLQDEKGAYFRLVPLPDVGSYTDEGGELLPATYANFLFAGDALIVPTYQRKSLDNDALATLREALPSRVVVGVNATTLVKWHGSIHCSTMQIAKGILSQDLLTTKNIL